MDAKCCDRCGEFYKNYYMRLYKSGHGYNTLKLMTKDTTHNFSFDLCPNCMGELQKWLKEGALLIEKYEEEKEEESD